MKTLTLVKRGITLDTASHSYKLDLEVTASEGITKEVFVKQRQKKPGNTTDDVFVAVATPGQLEELPSNTPASDTSYFRVARIELISQNPDLLNEVLTSILVELQALTDGMEQLTEGEVEGSFQISSGAEVVFTPI